MSYELLRRRLGWDVRDVPRRRKRSEPTISITGSDGPKPTIPIAGTDGPKPTIPIAGFPGQQTKCRPHEEAIKAALDPGLSAERISSGITRTLAKEALEAASRHGAVAMPPEVARQHRAVTIFAIVDALTRISAKLANAGERSATDQKASAHLSLAKYFSRSRGHAPPGLSALSLASLRVVPPRPDFHNLDARPCPRKLSGRITDPEDWPMPIKHTLFETNLASEPALKQPIGTALRPDPDPTSPAYGPYLSEKGVLHR